VLSRIERVSTTEAIVDQLIAQMRRGDLRPGDRLPSEVELMRMLGVGRSSIREAKQILVSKGIIEAHPGRGSFVCQPGIGAAIDAEVFSLLVADEHVRDLYEARGLLEAQIVGLAAQRATAEDLARIEAALRNMELAASLGESVYDAGMEFHLALVRAAHNPVLERLYEPIVGLLQAHQRPIYERLSDPTLELEQHRQILACVLGRDSDEAMAAMRQHLAYVATTTRSGGS